MELRETSFAEKLAGKAFLICFAIAVVTLLILLLHRFGLLNPVALRSFVESTGIWAPFILITLIAVGSSLTIPITPSIIISGLIFGPTLGALYAFIGVIIGASIAFFLARFFRGFIIKLTGGHAEILMRFQHRYVGWFIFFTRAIPIFNFEIISYAAGLTGISYGWYLLATATGIIIPTLFLTRSGAFIIERNSVFTLTLAIIMVFLMFFIPLFIDHYNPFGWKDKLLKKKHKGKLWQR